MPLTPGTRLGSYEIVSLLGRGGMGEVYRARDARLDRDVAIKVLPEDLATDSDRVRRFQQEARAIGALNHPHICQIHDVGPGYLVLEYIHGAPLGGPLAPTEAVRLILQVADALDTAHQKGILHRDLKPANILVTTDGRVKVLDFGLAKVMTSEQDVTRTTEGTVGGTPAYMSPEQAEGKPLDARSDVFSLGAVLYEVLSGTRAFGGDTAAQVVSAVLRDDPPPLAPPPLERIVRRCLAKQAAERFPSMHEVKVALEDMSRGCGDLKPSVAVLPFENMSGDKENEYFSDGLAEEIINLLARIPGLRVIARTSAFAFKGKHEDVRKIAIALGVTNVLEGSVRKAGSRIRVTAQLIDAADGSHVWSERYDRELADVFAVQDEIATAITAAFQVTLSAASTPLRQHTPNLPAYENYLRALHDSQRWTPESLERARACLARAITLDPQFALAHSELGHVFHRLAIYGLMAPRDALPLMRQEVRKALAIDPSLPEGHAMLGTVAAMFDYDWPEAERRFKLALAHDAVPSHVHRYYAHYCLLPLGRAGEGIEHHDIALKEDPLNLVARSERALCLFMADRPADAEDELRHILELDESFWFPYFSLSQFHAVEGRFDEGLRWAEQAYHAAPWFLPAVGVLAALLKRVGDSDRAEILALKLRPDDGYVDPIGPAIYHLLSGDLDATADWTEKAIDQRHPAVFFFLHVTAKALRSSPRWRALARMINLPE
jgi:serine/threonine protein kinase/Tfp pilus assembly protein PilF